MKTSIAVTLIILALVTLVSSRAVAQEMPRSVVSSGTVHATSSAGRVIATLGQPIAGRSASQSMRAWIGFWSAEPSSATSAGESDALEDGASMISTIPSIARDRTRIVASPSSGGRVVIRLVDVGGRELLRPFDDEVARGRVELDVELDRLSPGWYVVEMLDGTQRSAARLVVVR